MRRRLTVHTVGCKANFADSAYIVREAVAAGFEVVPPAGPADVVIVNSCTVTHRADRDSRALVRRARRAHPGALVVMTGCYARNSPNAKEKLPEADRWVGIRQRPYDACAIVREPKTRTPRISENAETPRISNTPPAFSSVQATFLKIQDGCDFSCLIASSRWFAEEPLFAGKSGKGGGRETRRPRELVLTGIHAGLYGADQR